MMINYDGKTLKKKSSRADKINVFPFLTVDKTNHTNSRREK